MPPPIVAAARCVPSAEDAMACQFPKLVAKVCVQVAPAGLEMELTTRPGKVELALVAGSVVNSPMLP